MADADVTISPPTIIHTIRKSTTFISTSMKSVTIKAININRHRLKTHYITTSKPLRSSQREEHHEHDIASNMNNVTITSS